MKKCCYPLNTATLHQEASLACKSQTCRKLPKKEYMFCKFSNFLKQFQQHLCSLLACLVNFSPASAQNFLPPWRQSESHFRNRRPINDAPTATCEASTAWQRVANGMRLFSVRLMLARMEDKPGICPYFSWSRDLRFLNSHPPIFLSLIQLIHTTPNNGMKQKTESFGTEQNLATIHPGTSS